jgi:hypothetical protein
MTSYLGAYYNGLIIPGKLSPKQAKEQNSKMKISKIKLLCLWTQNSRLNPISIKSSIFILKYIFKSDFNIKVSI